MRYHIVWLIALLCVTACAPQAEIIPAPSAEAVPGLDKAAVAEVTGVRVVVTPDMWTGEPAPLPDLTALHVTIDNHSGRSLRLRYDEFKLVSTTQRQSPALPPYQIEKTGAQPIPHPAFSAHRFWVAPHHAPYYPFLHPWDEPFAFDPFYYGHAYRRWRTPLPTQDMIEQAIPEGVLDEAGRVTGFLYFDEVSAETARVAFVMDLVDAKTEESFGTVRIPFVVNES